MSNTCIPNKALINKGINVTLHVAILFLILGFSFIFYVSKLTTQKAEEELTKLIDTNINDTLNNLPTNDQEQLKNEINSTNFDNVVNYYSQANPAVQAYNSWLFKTIILIIIFLFLIVALITLTSDALCAHINIGSLLIENILMFAGVGLIEFTFFYFVVLNYTPVPPSFMSTYLLNTLQTQL